MAALRGDMIETATEYESPVSSFSAMTPGAGQTDALILDIHRLLAKSSEDVAPQTLLREVEDVLKLNGIAADTQVSEIAKLVLLLKTVANKHAEDAMMPPRLKALMEYAKNASTAYASAFNGINIFGATTAYVIRNGGISTRLDHDPHIIVVLVALTMVFLPLSLLTVGLAHSLKYKLRWRDRVSTLLIMEVIYMMVMSYLFGMYILNGRKAVVIGAVCAAGSVLVFIPWLVFRSPDLLSRVKMAFKKVHQMLVGQELLGDHL